MALLRKVYLSFFPAAQCCFESIDIESEFSLSACSRGQLDEADKCAFSWRSFYSALYIIRRVVQVNRHQLLLVVYSKIFTLCRGVISLVFWSYFRSWKFRGVSTRRLLLRRDINLFSGYLHRVCEARVFNWILNRVTVFLFPLLIYGNAI